jgi:3-methyladenine DNA glycosylase AlkD
MILRRFFKTGPGEYGDGDFFLGITVPALRNFAKLCHKTTISETARLLRSRVHEERLLALLLLITVFSKGDQSVKMRIYALYLKNTRYINNWDLVDLSAPAIVGRYLSDKSRKPLYDLARSGDLWERRIAVLATFHFIKENDFSDTLNIAGILLPDRHDLIQKSVGWMLREIGKRDIEAEERFLRRHYKHMPRTMLRYAIERFPEKKRQAYLKGVAQTSGRL